MKNSTIIYICSEYPVRDVKPGGIGTFVYSIANALSKLGWDIEVWGMYDIEKFRVDHDGSIKIFQYPKLIKYSPIPERTALFFFKHHLSKRISHQSNVLIEASDWEALLVPSNVAIPLCVRFHDSHAIAFKKGMLHTYPKRQLKAVSKIIKQSSHCIFVSKFVADNILNTYGIFPEHHSIIYNGVDTDFFQPELSAQKMCRVVFIGSLLAQKGIFELAAAWNIINSIIPQAQLHIAGKGDFEPILNKIESEYRHNVVFHGTLDRFAIKELLNSAQICVFPSHWEAFSLCVAEAMSCGKTVVYSNTTTGNELIDDGVDGYLIDPFDIEYFASKVVLLLNDSILCEKIGSAARKKVLSQFSEKILIDKTSEVYKSLMSTFHCSSV